MSGDLSFKAAAELLISKRSVLAIIFAETLLFGVSNPDSSLSETPPDPNLNAKPSTLNPN